MIGYKDLLGAVAVGIVIIAFLSSCTDTELYKWEMIPYRPNKLTLSGTVCSDDLHQSNFPMKILFLVDMSQSLRAKSNDPNFRRGKAIEDVIGLWGKNSNYYFGVAIFGSRAANLLTDATGTKPIGFTRDTAKLQAAAAIVKSGGGSHSTITSCRAGRCRDLRAALSLASSIVSGDVLSSAPGEVARTTYAVILLGGGPPVPPLGRCPCRQTDDEKTGGKWAKCPWSECDGCKVTCPASTTCKGASCYPVCNPPCKSTQYCSPKTVPYSCLTGNPVSLPTVPPLSTLPTAIPDTYTFRIPPPGSSGKCMSLTCEYQAGGYPNSCEERLLILDVLEMKTFAIKNGAGQFQFHTAYLPDTATRNSKDPFYPPGPGKCAGNSSADTARTGRLLSQLAYAGNGGFQQFTTAEQIPAGFLKVGQDLYTSRDALVMKEFMVYNSNVLPVSNGIQPDTDADGLTDDVEQQLKTCISDEDTDGDGLSDIVEVKLATDPLRSTKAVECVDLAFTKESDDDPCAPGTSKTWTIFQDLDKDGLNTCEERLLGTEDSLYDSDADGIPDKIELKSGSNYLANDQLKDADLDGVVNRDEIRGHTNPRANDAQSQANLAYRYEEVDEGLKEVLSFTKPFNITGVTIKNVSPATSPGVGWLKFTPGPPPTLAWQDYADMGTGGTYGEAVEITKPVKDGYRLTSCRKIAGGGCTPDSDLKYITVLVDGPSSYPPNSIIEKINISSALRNCLRFRVRNITLMETGVDRFIKTRGNNTIDLYFAEAPQKAKSGYGIFRIASVLVNYTKGPPEQRTPKKAEITLDNDSFYLDISQ